MDKKLESVNPFKTTGKGVKVYDSGKQRKQHRPHPVDDPGCNCALCRMSQQITREVRGQFNRYGKI